MTDSNLPAQDFFTLDNFKRLNGEDYNPRDNRTYKMPPLANTPGRDIAIHLSVPDSVHSHAHIIVRTNVGNFMGNLFEGTDTTAESLVLHMPLASQVDCRKGMVKIESIKLPTLWPSWIIDRYSINKSMDHIVVHTSVDIYLKKGDKKFVILLDESFLCGLDKDQLLANIDKDLIVILKSKNSTAEYVGIQSESYQELLGFTGFASPEKRANNRYANAFHQLANNYLSMMLSSSQLEKVIVITYTTEKDILPKEYTYSMGLSMEFFIGGCVGQVVYPFKLDGSLNMDDRFGLQRDHCSASPLMRRMASESNEIYRIIPYSEEDFNVLLNLKEKMESIQGVIMELMRTGLSTEAGQLDGSLKDALKGNVDVLQLGYAPDKPNS